MRRFSTLRLSLLALVLAACGSSDTAQAPAGNGDTTVRNAGPARYAHGATFVQELQIGDATGADPYLFRTISDAIVANDRTIWILETAGRGGNPPSVRQFDAKGKFIRNVGRTGAGPGEYRSPIGIGQLPDGRVVVRDVGQSRINVYAPDGKSVDTWTLPTPYSWISNLGGGLDVDANGVTWMKFRPTTPDPTATSRTTYTRISSAGKIVDTVTSPALPALPSGGITITSGRSSSSYSAPYWPQNLFAWHPSGTFVTAVSSRYAIDLRVAPTPSKLWTPGDPVISIRRTMALVPVSEAERTDQAAILRQRVEATPGQRSNPIPDVPRFKPPVRAISVGDDGRLWVRVAVPSERFNRPPPPPGAFAEPNWREPAVYEVFESTGVFLGRATLPEGAVAIAVSRGDEVWCIVRDADEVHSLRKYQLVWR
jgi:hypothetical protein